MILFNTLTRMRESLYTSVLQSGVGLRNAKEILNQLVANAISKCESAVTSANTAIANAVANANTAITNANAASDRAYAKANEAASAAARAEAAATTVGNLTAAINQCSTAASNANAAANQMWNQYSLLETQINTGIGTHAYDAVTMNLATNAVFVAAKYDQANSTYGVKNNTSIIIPIAFYRAATRLNIESLVSLPGKFDANVKENNGDIEVIFNAGDVFAASDNGQVQLLTATVNIGTTEDPVRVDYKVGIQINFLNS